MKLGIVGAGGILNKILPTLRQLPELELYAIAAITKQEALAFIEKNGCFEVAYGSCAELVADQNVDLVYIATPHSMHYACVMQALHAGKPVLCEKPFAVNAAQARRIQEYAEAHHLFVAEAMWFRYMPSRKIIADLIRSNIVGHVHAMTGNLAYDLMANRRLTDPTQAGGALLDVGIYGLSLALSVFGNDVVKVDSSVQMTETGVDKMDFITLHFADGRVANLVSGICARSDRRGVFYGETGYIVLDNINNTRKIDVYNTQDILIRHLDMPEQISGYEFEWYEFIQAVKTGKTAAPSMPLSDTIAVLTVADTLRKQWGLHYPNEDLL